MSWKNSATFYLLLLCIVAESKQINGNVADETLQCKDENNRPVDWFVMYKLPKVAETSNPKIRKGISYLYITSETIKEGWQLSQKDITEEDSIPGRTLSPLYNDNVASSSLWILYNDQPPNGESTGTYGHTKGVVMTNGNIGFWLIHSVPGFPALPRSGTKGYRRRKSSSTITPVTEKESKINDLPDGQYGYPSSGKNYGQSFICISVNADQMDTIGRQLIYNQIITYRQNFPTSLANEYPVLVNASKRVRIKEPPYNNKETIRSSAGLEFISFAKSDKWQKDLYDDFVGPQFNSDLFAETWLNGRGKLPSECKGSKVMNVESVVLTAANVDFKSSHDHSKWAISTSNGNNGNWVCVGDINRADTQFNRGGGTLCMKSPKLWTQYKNSVNEVETCPKNTGVWHKTKQWFSSKFG